MVLQATHSMDIKMDVYRHALLDTIFTTLQILQLARHIHIASLVWLIVLLVQTPHTVLLVALITGCIKVHVLVLALQLPLQLSLMVTMYVEPVIHLVLHAQPIKQLDVLHVQPITHCSLT